MFKTIRSKFMLWFSILIIIFIVIVNAFMYMQERKALLNITIENTLETANLHGKIIGSFVEKNVALLSNIVNRDRVKELDIEFIVNELESILECCDIYQSAIFVNAQGDVINSHRESSNIIDREYFQTLMTGDVDYVISKPLVGKITGKPLVVFIVPIIDGEEILGGIGVSISLEVLSQIIQDFKFTGDSYAWIVDKDGDIIIHPDRSLWLIRNIHENEKLGFDGFNKLSGEILSNEMGYGYYYDKKINAKKVLAFSYIPRTDGWKLAITTSEKEIFRRVYEILNRVFIYSIFFLVIFSVINYKLIDKITEPINKLTSLVLSRDVNTFDELEMEETDDEIGKLVKAYNEMNKAIYIHTRELENLVEKRTEELKEANNKLLNYNRALERENINLYDTASKDELTGLFNRIELFKKLDVYNSNINRDLMNEYVVLFMDLDNFKYYNDNFGHSVGDQMLKYITEVLRSYIREGDFLARYGGDEFVLVIPNISYENALKIRDKLMKSIADMDNLLTKLMLWTGINNIFIPENSRLGLSIGVCHSSKKRTVKPEEMIRIADERMYKEKQLKKSVLD